jgi:hypothetical protein
MNDHERNLRYDPTAPDVVEPEKVIGTHDSIIGWTIPGRGRAMFPTCGDAIAFQHRLRRPTTEDALDVADAECDATYGKGWDAPYPKRCPTNGAHEAHEGPCPCWAWLDLDMLLNDDEGTQYERIDGRMVAVVKADDWTDLPSISCALIDGHDGPHVAEVDD